jgi:hypothetical protein
MLGIVMRKKRLYMVNEDAFFKIFADHSWWNPWI